MKTWYIGWFDEGKERGRFFPGPVLESAKVRFRENRLDEEQTPDRYAVFERRAEARKGLKAAQAYLPRCDYRLVEVGESKRDASRKVKGWVLIHRMLCAAHPYHQVSVEHDGAPPLWFKDGTKAEHVMASFDMFGENDNIPIFFRREDARRRMNELNGVTKEGPNPPRKERRYSVAPVYA